MKSLLRASFLCALLAGSAACDDDPTGAGPPAAVTIASGNEQTAPVGGILPQPIVVTVMDGDGDPVRGVEVRFSVTSGGGNIYPEVDSTDVSGQASTEWRLGVASGDSQRVQVQVMNRNGGVAATAVVRATAEPIAGRTLMRVSGEGQTAAVGSTLPDSLTVRLVNELGGGVPGVTVTWTVTPHAGSVSPVPSVTRADGTARVAWTLGEVTGAAGVVASVPGLPGVTFNGTSASPFTFTFTQPRADRSYSDSIPIQATAQSTTGPVVRMTARLEGREVNLSAGRGTMDLTGLPEGHKALLVWAVTAAGDSVAAVQRFVLNRAPQLTVVAPARGSVIRVGAARIDADCADPSGCTRVAVYASSWPDQLESKVLLAEGTTSFHGDAPLAAYNGRTIALVVEATDGLNGVSRSVTWPIHVESTPTWTEVASGGLQALDVDATRILYVDSIAGTARVYVRALAGGTATEILTAPAGQDVVEGRLFPGGAIFATEDGIYEYRGGVTTQLAGTPARGFTLDVEGTWAVWNVGNTLYRRDLTSGTSVVVSPTTQNNGNHVAPDGDVAFSSTVDQEVYLYSDGTTTPVSNGLRGFYPVTDGTQVVWGTGGSTYTWRGPGTAQLLSTITPRVTPPTWYEANGGWAAFVKADGGGIGHVFTVAPDGTQRQASSGGQSIITALGPDGTVVFLRPATGVNPRNFLAEAPYTGTALDVGGGSLLFSQWRFVGTELYAFVGRTAFRVNF